MDQDSYKKFNVYLIIKQLNVVHSQKLAQIDILDSRF